MTVATVNPSDFGVYRECVVAAKKPGYHVTVELEDCDSAHREGTECYFATPEELRDFLLEYADWNPDRRAQWAKQLGGEHDDLHFSVVEVCPGGQCFRVEMHRHDFCYITEGKYTPADTRQ